ncbi:uncharacterized [Tachysurus ichikawai]
MWDQQKLPKFLQKKHQMVSNGHFVSSQLVLHNPLNLLTEAGVQNKHVSSAASGSYRPSTAASDRLTIQTRFITAHGLIHARLHESLSHQRYRRTSVLLDLKT